MIAHECVMGGVDREALEMMVSRFDGPMVIANAAGWLHDVELREGADGAEVHGLVSGMPDPYVFVSLAVSDGGAGPIIGVHEGGECPT